jgi:hypothetical protein
MIDKAYDKKDLRMIRQAEHLRSVMAFERELIAHLGAWVCRLRHVHAKYMATHHLWEWAQHVDQVRTRLKELPGVKVDTPLPEQLTHILDETLFADDELPYLETLYGVILPKIKQEYEAYLTLTDTLPDRPSTTLVQNIIHSLSKQMNEGYQFLKDAYNLNKEDAASTWALHIKALLTDFPITSKPVSQNRVQEKRLFAGQTYAMPEIAHRTEGTYFTYNFPIQHFDGYFNNIDTERVALAVWLFNEMDAAEYIPTILYEIKGMPWEFYYDVARHTWDEARHSEFGYELLKQMDFNPSDFEVWTCTYMSTMKLSPYERYAAVTCIYEPGSFAVKPDYLEKLSNEISAEDWVVELLRFDLADETNHVRYGQKWVEKLMKHYGDERPVKDFVKELSEKITSLRAEQSKAFVTMMPPEKRMTYDKVKAHMQDFYEKQGSKVIAFKKLTHP